MGGYNSGSNQHGKSTTQGRNTLDVRKWQQALLMTPGTRYEASWGRSGAAITVQINTDGVSLIYRHGGTTDMDYPVQVAWTPCHYGGRRPWWLCPCCGKRCAILYAGKVFSCRQCSGLTYQSTRTAPGDKPFERADRLRQRLGWCAGIANDIGDKPKGMHWRTYERLMLQLHHHSREAMISTDRLVTRLKGKTGKLLDKLGLSDCRYECFFCSGCDGFPR